LVRRLENSGYNTVESSLRHVNETLERSYVSRGAFDKMAKGLQGYVSPHVMPGIPRTLVPVIQQVQSYGASLSGLKQIKEAIDRVRADLQEQRDENIADLRKVQKEIKDLRGQIDELENGRKSYPPYLLEAKKSLEEELAIRAGKPVPVEILADLIEVADETWQNAVEGFMGNNKLTLIVEPQYAKAALEAYRQLDAGRYHQVAVIDTEKVLADTKPHKRGSLAEEIECDLPHVQAYVDYLMGGLIKCDDIDELRKNRSGITADCVLYQGYKLQHINPRNYNEWAYIGKKSMQRKLSALKKRLNRQLSELAPLKDLREFLDEKLAMESLQQDFELILGQQTDVLSIPAKEAEKAKLEKQLAELKLQNVEEWKARKVFLDEAMKTNHARQQTAGGEKLLKDSQLKRENEAVVEKEKLLQEKEQEFAAVTGQDSSVEAKANQAGQDTTESKARAEARAKTEARRAELETGYQKLLDELDGSSFDRIRRVITQRLGEARDHQEQYYNKLLEARNRHQNRFSFREMDTLNRKNEAYDQLLSDLSEKRLPEFVERSGELARIAVEQFKNDFIYKIRSAIKEALQQKDDMNRILSRMDFGKDRYRFIVTKNRGADGRFYDLFMDEALEINPNQLIGHMENQMNLFTMEHESRHGDLIQELIEYFIPPEDASERELEEARRNMERYADYRTYLSFDMEQLVEGMAPAKLSRMLSKNSGGEGQNPLYVALLASFAQVYRMNLKAGVRRRATPRLVVLDEAFSQMDGEKVGSCIRLIRSLGYQAIISATNDKIQNYLESVNKAFVFANPDKSRIYIQEFERAQFGELLM
ncbi:MAG: chromosome segregation protein SMC, partial [Lachnospiraceae bacterium]|nr:chromosome segregation protein SMC [Lachnospiraceae bacterium]